MALGLAVCDTDTLDDFDGEVLSVGIDEIDGYTDCDTDILDQFGQTTPGNNFCE